jgi:hypothetical protein
MSRAETRDKMELREDSRTKTGRQGLKKHPTDKRTSHTTNQASQRCAFDTDKRSPQIRESRKITSPRACPRPGASPTGIPIAPARRVEQIISLPIQ